MKKKDLVEKYFSVRRLNTDIYADTYRWWMDDFLYQPYSINDIKKYREKHLQLDKKTKIDFYLHIPFCHTLCKYCDYYKVLISQKAKEDYLDYIFWYLEQFKEIFKEIEFSSIYIWWWTPSILSHNEIDNLLSYIFSNFKFQENWEKTFEVNPINITEKKLEVLKKYPINRISMWIQSTDPLVLEKSNRWYQKNISVENTMNLLKKYWFHNVNGDVIMWLKEDTLDSIKRTAYDMKKRGFSSIVLYRLLPSEEYLEEHFRWDIDKFNSEVIPRILSYYDFFSKSTDLWIFKWNKTDLYRWDLILNDSFKYEKYDDFSTKSLFWAWSSSRSQIFGNIFYKTIDNLSLKKDENVNIFLWRKTTLEDEKDNYKIVNILHRGEIDLEEYKSIFKSDFKEDNLDVLKYLDDKILITENNGFIGFDFGIEDKIFKSLYFLSDNNLSDKYIFLSRDKELVLFKFIKWIEISFLIKKKDNIINIKIWNNFSINEKNIDLFKKIVQIAFIIKIEIEKTHIQKEIEEIDKIFKNMLLKTLSKFVIWLR